MNPRNLAPKCGHSGDQIMNERMSKTLHCCISACPSCWHCWPLPTHLGSTPCSPTHACHPPPLRQGCPLALSCLGFPRRLASNAPPTTAYSWLPGLPTWADEWATHNNLTHCSQPGQVAAQSRNVFFPEPTSFPLSPTNIWNLVHSSWSLGRLRYPPDTYFNDKNKSSELGRSAYEF